MKKLPVEVFSTWATNGRDEGMEKNHSLAVGEMLTFATAQLENYRCIDAGCGNGWVVRQLDQQESCQQAIGVDGSETMIQKAQRLHPTGTYYCSDLMEWQPQSPVDLVHSMEVFYYMPDPQALISHIYHHWLNEGGRLIIGLDFYQENPTSHSWPEDCGISIMQLFSEEQWKSFFQTAGFHKLQTWRVGAAGDWAGTLVVTGVKS
ncbi:MAG: class I SAM-dependent methyltransferase [Flavobacteriaceae bacterium]